MRDGFKKIFWGLILISFHINVGTFDILPDFVGYYLIYAGCNSLKNEEESFKKVCMPTLALMVVNLLGIVSPILNIMQGESNSLLYILSIICNLALRIINMIMVYYICKGIYNISIRFNIDLLKNRARWVLNWTLIAFTLSEIATSFLLNGRSDLLGAGIIILSIFRFILNICLMVLVNNASKEFIV